MNPTNFTPWVGPVGSISATRSPCPVSTETWTRCEFAVQSNVRDAPSRIVRVTHRESTGRYRGRHYLTIATDSAKLMLKEPDWTRLYDKLQRRCPSASFEP